MSKLHTHHSKHGNNIRSKSRREKVAKKHAKTIKGLDPKVVAALLQAAFAAGELRVSALNASIAKDFLSRDTLPDGMKLLEDGKSLLQHQDEAWVTDSKSYKDEVSNILDGLSEAARAIFADTIAVEDVSLDNNEGDEGLEDTLGVLFAGDLDDDFGEEDVFDEGDDLDEDEESAAI